MKNKELKEILSECMREAGSLEDFAERLIAADVVPVVRCKDCKYLIEGMIGEDLAFFCKCPGGMVVPDPGLYCSYGERSDK